MILCRRLSRLVLAAAATASAALYLPTVAASTDSDPAEAPADGPATRSRDRMALWQRGDFLPPEPDGLLRLDAHFARRLRPILSSRGGSSGCDETGCEVPATHSRAALEALAERLGPAFAAAVATNVEEHARDCAESCEYFYCAPAGGGGNGTGTGGGGGSASVGITSYSMGAVPPEDFAGDFNFPLDLIKVTTEPLFSAAESAGVVAGAEAEGISQNEYQSGKYKLGGDWLKNLPDTLRWFNRRLEDSFFPLMRQLFPEVVKDESVLRAHSVSLLKYNSSHPRTDVHVDNGILAMTLAMTPADEYVGGGTFFEHMGKDVLEMDVGHGTFRPGSVRHGGHRVSGGTRYILGAFLLIEDKVEHVRRLKNRGALLRQEGDFEGAVTHFRWALEINPRCTTCLKDWAEVLHTQKRYAEATVKIRQTLHLLEGKDSDALFILGLLLSEQGDDEGSIAAYRRSVSMNAEDAVLCYNLGVKLGTRGDGVGEREMYSMATSIDPTTGLAWLNWGTSLAEAGDLDAAEAKFLAATHHGDAATKPKAAINLSLVYKARARKLAGGRDLEGAAVSVTEAGRQLESARAWVESAGALSGGDDPEGDAYYADLFGKLRLETYQFAGWIHSVRGDFAGCEREMRGAAEMTDDPEIWGKLVRILQHVGKTEEAQQVAEKVQAMMAGAR